MHGTSTALGETSLTESAPSDRDGACSKGTYIADQQLVAIRQQRGKLLHRMGIQQGQTLYLRLEEAMYLLEKGLLSVELLGAQHTAAAGISELRHLMENAGIPLHNYTVYKELMNASLIVTRYPAQWIRSKPKQASDAEPPAKQEGIEENKLRPYKRLKLNSPAPSGMSSSAEEGAIRPKQRHWWPSMEPMPDSSHTSQGHVEGTEAPSSSIGEWSNSHRPNLRPLSQCPVPSESSMTLQQPATVYDVYKANSHFSRKKPRGLSMRVHMSQSRPPSRKSMCAAEAACQEGEAVNYATATDDHVSMYSFQHVCLPNLFQGKDS